jgi:Ice-binding-like
MALSIDQLLGSAVNFEVLGASTVTNSGATTINGGNLGLYPGTSITGFPPGVVESPYVTHQTDAVADQAEIDATTAYNYFQALAGGIVVAGGELAGMTLTPGIYKATSTLDLSVGATVTLNGNGDPNAVFIFQVASALTINTGATVLLTNGTLARNVIWLVGSSATINAGATMQGDVVALSSVSLGTGGVMDGRAIGLTGAVTLLGNTMTSPIQAVPIPPVPPIGTSSVPATILLSELCFPDITGKTIRAWGIVTLTPGGYSTGGIPMGLVNFLDVRTVDYYGFLRCQVWGEEPINNVIGTSYSYHYSPVNDSLQIFNNGTELASTQTLPLAVLADVLLFEAKVNRTTVLG